MGTSARQTVGAKRVWAAFILVAMGIVSSLPAEAAVWRVNAASTAASPDGQTWANAYRSIQPAVDAAASGDEIWVAAGTYTGTGDQVVNLKAGITLYGGFVGTETTPEQRDWATHPTVIDGGGERRGVLAVDVTSTVDGFTLRNGMADEGGGMFGGMAVNCTFAGNLAYSLGGGMCSGTATNCSFTGNWTYRSGFLSGGGGMFGGTASNCVFHGNTAFGYTACYGDYGDDCYSFGGHGGGMLGGTATNCTFAENSATFSGDAMGYSGTVVNCIFWQNTGYGMSVSYSCLPTAAPGAGNIVGDPLFVDAAVGDFRLGAGSPCTDAGTGDGAPAADILGVPRPQGTGFDMGAYEAVVPVTVPDLSGLARTAARDLVVAAQLYVRDEKEGYHPTVLADHVIRQNPAAGTQTLSNTPVDLVVSKGPGPDPVPGVWYVSAASVSENPDGKSWATAYTAIQPAVDAAASGGEVWVAAGTYTAGAWYRKVVVQLKSGMRLYGGFDGAETVRDQRDWKANTTVIDGQRRHGCVDAFDLAGTVDGFTLQNGNLPNAGGMSYGTAVNCLFRGNVASGLESCEDDVGGGVNCGYYAGRGGGKWGGNAVNCIFTENRAISRSDYGYSYGSGGGFCGGIAINCTFTRNSADFGGGMSSGTATNCTFTENTSGNGGGMGSGTATNCTFTRNSAYNHGCGMYGGTATNCIIWGNNSEEVSDTAVSYSCLSLPTEGTGNMVANPLFVNLWAGDLRLRAGSPCVDAGTADGAPSTDILGRLRPRGAGVDMGAYEYCPGDDAQADPVGTVIRVNGSSTAAAPDGLTWATAYATLQAAAAAAASIYCGEIWVATGTYTTITANEVVKLVPGTALFGGFLGTEIVRDQRDWAAHPTVIDGQGARRCVSAGCAVLVDGFTLQNGLAYEGGGMFGGSAANCMFTENSASYGGGGMSRGTATNCTFTGNSASGGGGMSQGTATDCTFTDNAAADAGGGMWFGTATNSSFTENSADFGGGGMCYGTATNCTFTGNLATRRGGGMYDGTATNCTFIRNSGTDTGGGMWFGTATNCTFTGNTADWVGGGMCYGTATNCTFTGNLATRHGGGMESSTATNCVIWGNAPDETYDATVKFSCLSVATSGDGNIVGDPLFVNAAAGDFWLQAGSPCIDTGTGDGAPSVDMLGVPRPQGAGYDMGAYEAVVPVTVPDLSGLARAAARDLIAAAQLYVRDETDEYHPTVSNDHVIRQNPAAGAEVLSNTPVDLVISKGPEPMPVPNVVGQTQEAAAATLTGAGFVVGALTQGYNLTVPPGTVMAQSPAPGTEVIPGTAIDLMVSKGGIAVPDVVGQAQGAASTALTSAGLVVGTVTQQYSATVPVGAVISQTPTAGTPVLPGTPVVLVTSRGVQPSVMPDVAGQPRAQAEAAIAGAGLALGLVTQDHSGTVAAGNVIAQSPPAGTEVPPGTVVSIVVSLGPAPVVEGEGEPVDAETVKEALAAAYDSADSDGDGTLSFDEATTAIAGLPRGTFDALDSNGDGQLSAEELGLDDGSGCAGCQGGKSAFQPKRLADLFLMVLCTMCLGVLSANRRW